MLLKKLYITLRAKTLGSHIVSRAKFDLKTGMTKEWQHIDMPRNTINISTLTLGDVVHVFNGSTTAGGFYVTTLDAKTFTKISDYMLVDQNTNPWGWDMRKICASPLVEGDDLMLTYLSNFKVGLATMDLNNLPSGNKIP
jgi:hypothetical protein